jgi:prolyl-tRNA synthetase
MADEAQSKAAVEIYQKCRAAGLDVLLDDRDERPGVKFKDADLIGIPYRITVGKKLANGIVEITQRRGKKTFESPVATAAGCVAERIGAEIKK